MFAGQQLNILYENLKKWYRKLKSTRSIVEETIWSVFPTYPCIGYLSVFHDLSQQGHTSTLKLLGSVQELFEENGSLHPQHVLLEGHTGIGKTTLCKEICYQWAENNLFMPEELVLLLLLQDPCARKITSEHGLAKYFTTSFDFIKSFSEYLTSSCGAGVTIVIDSYDQLNEELLEERFIKDLVERKRLPYARIIITSTPFVSYHLHDCVDRRVEIFDLVKSIRNKFIAAALKNFPAKLQVLQEHFLKYPEVDMLACVPINMAIIVSLCNEDNLSLPCDITSMYRTFCESVIEMNCSFVFHIQQERPGMDFHNEAMWYELKYSARKILNSFAYKALIKDNLIFLETDIFNMCRKYPTCYGFIQSTECYSSAHHNKRMLCNFLSQGMHQYLAAIYVTKFNADAIVQILKNCLPTTKLSTLFYYTPIEWSVQVFKMCIVALNQEKYPSEYIISEIINYLNESFASYNIHSQASRLNFSAKQNTIYKKLFQLPCDTDERFDVSIEKKNLIRYTKHCVDSGYSSTNPSPKFRLQSSSTAHTYSPFHIFYLFQLFQNYLLEEFEDLLPFRNGVIYFNQSLLPHHIISLGLFLSKANHVSIHELHLVDCCIGDYGLYLLQRYLCNSKRYELKVLNLYGNNLTSASSMLISILIDFVKPQSLDLSYNKLTGEGVSKFCNAVIRNKVCKLDLVNIGLTAQATKSIGSMMCVLKELDISNNNIGDQGTKILSQGLACTQTLKRLDINHCSIGAMGTGELACALTINSSLEILWMNGNAIGHLGAAGIAASLSVNKTLKELSLTGDPTIDYIAASEILESYMNKNTTLIKLCLPKSLSNKFLITVKYNTIHEYKKKDNKPRSLFFQ